MIHIPIVCNSHSGAANFVFVTLFCTAVGTAIAWCGGCCAMPDGHSLNILLLWQRSMAALVFRVGACLESSLFFPPSPLHPRLLIGLLASVDVKQHYSQTNRNTLLPVYHCRPTRPPQLIKLMLGLTVVLTDLQNAALMKKAVTQVRMKAPIAIRPYCTASDTLSINRTWLLKSDADLSSIVAD